MGKSLIIKGANFSQVAVDEVTRVYLGDYEEWLSYLTAGSTMKDTNLAISNGESYGIGAASSQVVNGVAFYPCGAPATLRLYLVDTTTNEATFITKQTLTSGSTSVMHIEFDNPVTISSTQYIVGKFDNTQDTGNDLLKYNLSNAPTGITNTCKAVFGSYTAETTNSVTFTSMGAKTFYLLPYYYEE